MAAGRSQRYGRNKLALPLPEGETVGERALRGLLEAVGDGAPVVLVTTPVTLREAFLAVAAERRVRVVYADPNAGQGDSLAAGIRAVRDGTSAGAAWIALADQPYAFPAAYGPMWSAWQADDALWAVAARGDGVVRPPVLVRRVAFDRLATRSGDTGGREVLRSLAPHVAAVDVPGVLWMLDVDTPEAYEALLRVRAEP